MDQSVGDLKTVSKEKKSLKNVDAKDLLFLAKKDNGKGAWLTENDRHFSVEGVDIRITERMTFDPPTLVRFWRAFQGDRTEFKADAVFTLPEGTFLLGNPMLGSRIYIRHCYPRLWQVCLKMIHDEAMNTPHLVILGNPGIGKTYFGYVVLWLLARSGNTVVYERGASEQRFLFSQDMVVEGSKNDFIPILKQTTTYYIVDGVKPKDFPAKTILLTLPRHEVWWEFNKTCCRSCYMPVWSRDEVLTCRELMYSDIPESVVQDCFRRWGGIPRYVLEYATAGDQHQWLEKMMDSVQLNWLMKACAVLDEDPPEILHQFLHYRVTKEFNTDYFVFASQYVLEGVYRRLYSRNKQNLLEFIENSGWVGAIAVLRSHLFEGYVHSVLFRGGTFEIRLLVDDSEAHDDEARNGSEIYTEGCWNEGRLRRPRKGKNKDDGNTMDVGDDVLMEDWESSGDDDDEDQHFSGDVSSIIPNIASIGTDVTTITLPARRSVVFDSANGLEAGDLSSYLRPAVKNYQSVDVILKPNVMFQVTSSKEHHCKQAGLYDVLKLLNNPAAPALIFVLPPDRFLSFGYQKYHNTKGEAVEQSKYHNVRKIRQFAMKVKIDR